MALNLFNHAHKATNENYRREYDRIFRGGKDIFEDENTENDTRTEEQQVRKRTS